MFDGGIIENNMILAIIHCALLEFSYISGKHKWFQSTPQMGLKKLERATTLTTNAQMLT